MRTCKVIMIGVDGARWIEIMRFMDQGKLPNFRYLIENGVRGMLESMDPPYTPIVWTTISSGKRPEKHGVVSVSPTRYDVKTLEIWDIIEDHGGSIGLFNWPVTWPPRKANGFVIPGTFARSTDTFPTQLDFIGKISEFGRTKVKNRHLGFQDLTLLNKAIENGMAIGKLKDIIGYILKSKFMNKEINEVHRQIIGQSLLTDLYANLYRKFKPSFSAYYLSAIDTAAHLTWKYHEPEKFGIANSKAKNYGQLISSSYENTDKCIGKILHECVDKNTAIIVVSDHGTRAATEGETTFKINANKLFEGLGIEEQIDYFYAEQGIYFSVKDPLLEEKILERIWEVKLCENGRKIFRISQSDIRHLYSIKCEDFQIEGIDHQSAMVELDGWRVKLAEIVQKDDYRISGIHDKHGIFIACGQGIKKYKEVNLRVVDIVPTLLYYLRLPVGRDMDGHIEYSIFEESFRNENQSKYIPTYDTIKRKKRYLVFREKSEIGYEGLKERLEALGYI